MNWFRQLTECFQSKGVPAEPVRFFTVPKKKKGDFDGGFKIIS